MDSFLVGCVLLASDSVQHEMAGVHLHFMLSKFGIDNFTISFQIFLFASGSRKSTPHALGLAMHRLFLWGERALRVLAGGL
jgi:hypothetical protein